MPDPTDQPAGETPAADPAQLRRPAPESLPDRRRRLLAGITADAVAHGEYDPPPPANPGDWPRGVADPYCPSGHLIETPIDHRLLWHIEGELAVSGTTDAHRDLAERLREYLTATCRHHWHDCTLEPDVDALRQCLWCNAVEWGPVPPPDDDPCGRPEAHAPHSWPAAGAVHACSGQPAGEVPATDTLAAEMRSLRDLEAASIPVAYCGAVSRPGGIRCGLAADHEARGRYVDHAAVVRDENGQIIAPGVTWPRSGEVPAADPDDPLGIHDALIGSSLVQADLDVPAADPEAPRERDRWHVLVTVPLDLPDDMHNRLFTAIADVVHDWEPDDRDGWDAFVSGYAGVNMVMPDEPNSSGSLTGSPGRSADDGVPGEGMTVADLRKFAADMQGGYQAASQSADFFRDRLVALLELPTRPADDELVGLTRELIRAVRMRAERAEAERDRLALILSTSESVEKGYIDAVAERDATITELHAELNHAGDELVKARTERDDLRATLGAVPADLRVAADLVVESGRQRDDAYAQAAQMCTERDIEREAAARVRELHRPDLQGVCLGCRIPDSEPPTMHSECPTLAALDGTDGSTE